MIHQSKARVLRLGLALALGVGLATSPQAVAQAQGPVPQQPQAPSKIYLPLIRRTDDPPQFKFISPASVSTLTGTVFVAVQSTNGADMSSVSFRAGTTDLGTDSTSGDGFKAILDLSKFPSGALQISATAKGRGGQTTQTLSVNTVATVDNSTIATALGATVQTTGTGSTIVIPPGGVAPGVTVELTEISQAQVQAQDGINWDKLGVTFLGAIDIDVGLDIGDGVKVSTTLSKPVSLDLRGFANRVQPGQALVMYRIGPDADGDGAGELQVINGAELAANGAILSSPVNDLMITSLGVVNPTTGNAHMRAPQALDAGLSGKPGQQITMIGNGFNLYSSQGNIAIFKSLVDGTEAEMPGTITWNDAQGSQTFKSIIPFLKPGAATFTLVNKSTSSRSGPYALTIEQSPALTRPAQTIIDESLATLYQQFESARIATDDPNQKQDIEAMKLRLIELRTRFQTLAANATADEKQLLDEIATIFETSKAGLVGNQNNHERSPSSPECDRADLLAYAAAFGLAAAALAAAGNVAKQFPPHVLTYLSTGLLFGAAAVSAAVGSGLAYQAAQCKPPPPCPIAPSAPPGRVGMGVAPPQGGPGCGGAGGGGGGPGASLRPEFASQTQNLAGRYAIKIYAKTGTPRQLSPFTGFTDAGGYFVIPLIPNGEQFRAVAIDMVTGASVVREGVGVTTTRSVFLNFNFAAAASNIFPYSIGQTISDGVPSAGAGNIDVPGGMDIYTFNATAGQRVYLDVINFANNTGGRSIRIQDNTGATVQSTCFTCLADVATLTRGGSYTMTVGGDSTPTTGTYSLRLVNAPAPQQFAIAVGDTIADGVPSVGAGNIEARGGMDVYTFNATPKQRVSIQMITRTAGTDQRKVLITENSTGYDLLQTCFSCSPIIVTLREGGLYTLTVGGDGVAATGAYSLKLLPAPPADEFAIQLGDTVGVNVPGPGAGRLENVGSLDIYTFTASAGQRAFIEVISNTSSINNKTVRLRDSTGKDLQERSLRSSFGEDVLTLTQGGVYSIIVGEDSTATTGTYSLKLWSAPPPQYFAIAVGDSFFDGAPVAGAGKIEERGGMDIYTFTSSVTQKIVLDYQNTTAGSSLGDVTLTDDDPQGLSSFCSGQCNDDMIVFRVRPGYVYTVTIGGSSSTLVAAYRLKLWSIPTPDVFAISIGDTITNGVPGAGAGHIETPGVQDVYTFNAAPGQQIYVDRLAFGSTGVGNVYWQIADSAGATIFDTTLRSSDPGVRTLTRGGAYTLTVNSELGGSFSHDREPFTGTYGFKLWSVLPPQQFAINIGDTITNGVPGAGAGHIESPGVQDVYTFNATPGQRVYVDVQAYPAGALSNANWTLQSSSGATVDSACLRCDSRRAVTLTSGGAYTLTVNDYGGGDGFGLYGFKVWDVPAPQQFAIAVGDTITNGVPAAGAGNIETPGVQDVYTFSATPGQQVFFDLVSRTGLGMNSVQWRLNDSAGAFIFNTCFSCSDPGTKTLALGGTYTITVNAGTFDNAATGSYSFLLRNP